VSATENVAVSEQRFDLAGKLAASVVRPAVYSRRQWLGWVVAVGVAALVSLLIHGAYGYNIATNAGLYGILAVGFFYQFALAGQFSFATPTFYAIGAYVYAWSAKHLDGFVVGFIAAAVITALIGAAVKIVLSRSPLIHFAIATLAVGALGIILLRNWHSFTGGDQGRYNITPAKIAGLNFDTPFKQYALVAGTLLIGVGLALFYERSATQRDTMFVRDMGPVARTVGLPSLRIQCTNFGVGAGYMGAAGAVYAATAGFVTTTSFDVTIALQVLVMVLVGGIATVWGAVIGAIGVYELQSQALQSIPNYQDLVYAVLILAVILVLPGGLTSLPGIALRQLRQRTQKR
jgi:branched-chain amino acid transport system permease protein